MTETCIRQACRRKPYDRSEFGYCRDHALENEPALNYVPDRRPARPMSAEADKTLRLAMIRNTAIFPTDTAAADADAHFEKMWSNGGVPPLADLEAAADAARLRSEGAA